ncbi:MAG TPA: toxin-antitoxin system YwqK family antitoxin [Flavobacteriales bacterium]|nr:toxin-antitoxin system YwqK family antitoxin [Flavobacteriales bacterium]
MKLILVFFFTIFFQLIGLYGQTAKDTINEVDENGLKNGYWIKLYPNGNIDYKGYFVKGRPAKIFKRYYKNGNIKSSFIYFDNNKACAAHIYGADSVLIATGLYRKEKRDSTWKYYRKNGELVSDENYRIGIKYGMSNTYYYNNKLYERFEYKNGKKDGVWKQYFEKGGLKIEGHYQNDKLQGKAIFYYPNGNVDHEGFYKDNVKNDAWNYYDERGNLLIQQRFDMGILKNKDEVEEYILQKRKKNGLDNRGTREELRSIR